MTAALLPNAKAQFIDSTGKPLAGGKVYFYVPNTSTLKNTYQDAEQTILNTNPIILDVNGQAIIWGTGVYRQVVYDQLDNLIWDQITEDISGGLIGNFTDDVFVATIDFTPGVTSSLTLTTDPGSIMNMWVFFDGIFQGDDQILSLSYPTLTFTAPIPVGVTRVTVKIGNTVAMGVPGDSTVTTAKLAWGKDLPRVVDTIAALRALATPPYQRAIVIGYYQAGDGGNGTYWYDPSDTTSADNGWSVIVAANGARWKRLNTIKQFNGNSNDIASCFFTREANYTGGTPGFVNGVMRLIDDVSDGPTAFEWTLTSIMNNSASSGENVALYGQGNRMTVTAGGTWGGVMEAQEKVPIANPTTNTVGLEVDCRSNGTDNNGQRIGLMINCSRWDAAGPATETSYGLLILNNADVSSRIKAGIYMSATSMDVGIDLSPSQINVTAIRLKSGQTISMDQTDTNRLFLDTTGTTGIGYRVSGTTKVKLINDGSIQMTGSNGVTLKPIATTGSATPTLGANKPGANGAPATWLSVVVDGNQYWIPAWSN